MSIVAAFSFAAISTQQSPKINNNQLQSVGNQGQSSAFEQLIASLTGGLSSALNLDGSNSADKNSTGITTASSSFSADSLTNANQSSNQFMEQLLAALQFLQDSSTTKPHHPRNYLQDNDAAQQAAAAAQTPPTTTVDSSVASDVAVSAPVASI